MNLKRKKMKNTLIGIAFLLTLAIVLPPEVSGQAQGGQNGPPSWAPAHGYRAKTRHIYFPDQNFYFDLQKNVYIYFQGGSWEVSVKLPTVFAGINLQTAAKVELELNMDSPQKYNGEHVAKYNPHPSNGKAKGTAASGNPGKGKGAKK
jgi:hypothetical protein